MSQNSITASLSVHPSLLARLNEIRRELRIPSRSFLIVVLLRNDEYEAKDLKPDPSDSPGVRGGAGGRVFKTMGFSISPSDFKRFARRQVAAGIEDWSGYVCAVIRSFISRWDKGERSLVIRPW